MAVHGGDVYTASEILGNLDVVDFSANINPLGVPDSVHEAIVQNIDRLRNYPDPSTILPVLLGLFHHRLIMKSAFRRLHLRKENYPKWCEFLLQG